MKTAQFTDSVILASSHFTFFNAGVNYPDVPLPTSDSIKNTDGHSVVLQIQQIDSAIPGTTVVSLLLPKLEDGVGSLPSSDYETVILGTRDGSSTITVVFPLKAPFFDLLASSPTLLVNPTHKIGPTTIMFAGTPRQQNTSSGTKPPIKVVAKVLG